MSFLALASQKSLLSLQKNFLQLQYISISNQSQSAQAQMAAVKKSHKGEDNYDESEDATYLYYEQLDEQLSSEKEAIDTQMTAIDNQISSLKTLVNNNVKSSCTLNLSSGG